MKGKVMNSVKMLRCMWWLGLVCATAAHADIQVSTGLDYSEGKYGSNITTKQTTVPLIGKYETDTWSVKASLPYVWIKNVNSNSRGESLPCGNAAATPKDVDGFGDLVLAGSYSVYAQGDTLVDVNAKAKIATGDEDQCLSSGQHDYSASVDLTQRFGALTAFGTLGWTKKGDPEFAGIKTNYDDPVFASLGASYKVATATSVGASYDYRQKLTSKGDPISEMTVFVSQKLPNNLRMQGYAVAGFSDASADLGVGVLMSHRY
jgi:hypothetical protein